MVTEFGSDMADQDTKMVSQIVVPVVEFKTVFAQYMIDVTTLTSFSEHELNTCEARQTIRHIIMDCALTANDRYILINTNIT